MPSEADPRTCPTSTPRQRIDAVTAYWLDVMGNYYRDMAGTRTPAEARAVEDNYNAAERAYLDAIECGLTATRADADAAFAALVAASKVLTEARSRMEAFATILEKLGHCTEAATHLVRAASP